MDQDIVEAYAVDIENFHHVAREILKRLYTRQATAYADLKPHELTGNSFNYHLRHVVAQKLVEQDDAGQYRLSARGRLLMDSVSLDSMKLKLRPVAGVMLLVTSAEKGILVYDSNREPLRGTIGLPFGKLRLGDSVEATVSRVLEKRGIRRDAVTAVTPLGIANIRYYERGDLVSHRLASVWKASYTGDSGESGTKHGASEWADPEALAAGALDEIRAVWSWKPGDISIEISQEVSG